MQTGGGFSIVDVVHRSFLAGFLDDELRPFTHEFFERFLSFGDEVIAGSVPIRDDPDMPLEGPFWDYLTQAPS